MIGPEWGAFVMSFKLSVSVPNITSFGAILWKVHVT